MVCTVSSTRGSSQPVLGRCEYPPPPIPTYTFTHMAITLCDTSNSSYEGAKAAQDRPPPPDYIFTWRRSKANRAAFTCITTLLCGDSTAGPTIVIAIKHPQTTITTN